MTIPTLEQLSQIGEIVTGLGVLFVFVQVRQTKRNGEVELITGLTTLVLEVDRLFVEYPEMRKYFVEGAKPPRRGTDEWERANAMAMAMANTLDHVVEHLDLMKLRSQRSWRRYIAEVHEKSDVLKELLEEHSTWWPGLQLQLGRDQACIPRAQA